MTLIEYFKRFWEMDEKEHFTPNETRLYFVLLRRFNKLYFPDVICIKESEIVGELHASTRAMHTARERLVAVGLIGFTPGGNGRGCPCRWYLCEKLGQHLGDLNSIPNTSLVYTLGDLNSIPKASLGSTNRVPNSALIGTRDIDNIKDNKDNIVEVEGGPAFVSPHQVNIFIRGNPAQKEQIALSVHRVTHVLLKSEDIDRWLDEFETFLGATMRTFTDYREASYNFLTWLTKQISYEQQQSKSKQTYTDREDAKQRRDQELNEFIARAGCTDRSQYQGVPDEMAELSGAMQGIPPF